MKGFNIYLSKNHIFDTANNSPKNTFVFSENGKNLNARWLCETIKRNDCNYVVFDHNYELLSGTKQAFSDSGYYSENIILGYGTPQISISPFSCVKDVSDIHSIFLSLLHLIWDGSDKDLPAMSNLLDAYASCIFSMFKNNPDRMTMRAVKKMISSVRANYVVDPNNKSNMMDAIFDNIKDQESMPCKYYAQFLLAAGDRKYEIAEKLAVAFDSLSDIDIEMMSKTDSSIVDSFSANFKTVFFVNSVNPDLERSARILYLLLNRCITLNCPNGKTVFIIDSLAPDCSLIELPSWLRETGDNCSHIIICNDLASFKETDKKEQYFRNIKKGIGASVLMHHNDVAIKYQNKNPITVDEINESNKQEFIATILIPSLEISENDVLF